MRVRLPDFGDANVLGWACDNCGKRINASDETPLFCSPKCRLDHGNKKTTPVSAPTKPVKPTKPAVSPVYPRAKASNKPSSRKIKPIKPASPSTDTSTALPPQERLVLELLKIKANRKPSEIAEALGWRIENTYPILHRLFLKGAVKKRRARYRLTSIS